MKLNLKNPLIFFDLETTGVDVVKDRIVEISYLKMHPGGNRESKTILVNPTIPIPPAVTEIHGIKDEDVKDSPTFPEIARALANDFEGCDIAGYNSNKFDLPLLAEEFLRADVDFDLKKRKFIDVQVIFHKREQRTLEAA
jgi:DNA polymerase III subunit epsilon